MVLLIFQGDSEFIGRALARPVVKLASEKYDKPNFPPALEWFEIQRGDEKAGELLAAFELLHVSFSSYYICRYTCNNDYSRSKATC